MATKKRKSGKKVSSEPKVPTSFQEYYAPSFGDDYLVRIDQDTPSEVADVIRAIEQDRERRKALIAIAALNSDVPELVESSDILHMEIYV